MEQMSKWLITGGCGFIGRNFIKYLLSIDRAAQIRVIDDFSVGTLDDLIYATDNYKVVDNINAIWESNTIEVVKGNILDEDLAFQISSGADIIIHLAANTGVGPSVLYPRMDCNTNVMGTLNYLEACRINKIKRFVFASSGAPIGECVPPIHEEMPCHPVSPYGASKLAGEAYCSAYYNSFEIDTVALRFGNVYGPGSSHKASVVAKFIKMAMNGETLEVYGDGSQTRDFIYTKDLVDAIFKAATKPNIGGEIFQIATSKETTISELCGILVNSFNETGSERVNVVNGEKRVGDVMRNFSDTSKALKHLKWTAMTDLKDGILQTLQWFRNSQITT